MSATRQGRTGLHTAENRSLMTRLAEARRAAHLTQHELAERLGVDQTYVSKYESGRRRLDVIEFLRIVAAIGVSAGEVLDGLITASRQS